MGNHIHFLDGNTQIISCKIAMETPKRWACRWCGRTTFQSQKALRSHIAQSFCSTKEKAARAGNNTAQQALFGARQMDDGDDALFPMDNDDVPYNICHPPAPAPPRKTGVSRSVIQAIQAHDVDAMTIQMAGLLQENEDDAPNVTHQADEESKEDSEEDSEEDSDEESENVQEEAESGANSTDGAPIVWIRDQFRIYCEHAKKEFKPFTKEEAKTLRLLHLLKDKNAPMNAYDSVMLWHYKECNALMKHQKLEDSSEFIGRKTMIKRLIERYNFEDKMPIQTTVKLPVSGTVVKLTCHNAQATIQRLLTDPRIEPSDYLFWDGDPLKGPPDDLDYVADLNTGLAYLETYARIINQEARQQLMPIVIYFDGTAVSHFHDMEITQVNIALGTMSRIARTKGHCWAPLGYIEKIHEQGGRGRTILQEANHVETQDAPGSDDDSTENMHDATGVGDKSDQDFHAMMSVILKGLIEIQGPGFIWDHHDAQTGQDTRDIHYKIFVPFLKVDGKEADLACAKYGQRSTTQQICRKCHIPLQQADDHTARFKMKTVSEIKKLIDKADIIGLKSLSQTYLRNAFYDLRFSVGNDHGVHGSCPSELLHAFLLGTFKYIRDIFFDLIGPTSEGAKLINALSKVYGKLFCRQSDRTMPGTAFSNGIQVGKLMAKDYRGVLLIMLAIVQSSKGREILKRNRNFKDLQETTLNDWILLLEAMLEWESYLNEPKMYVKHVKRLEKKHRYIMYLIRKIAQRTEGMGLKLLKFHTILHIWEDILQFGVPLEYDTAANESMHKPSKKASKMTQRAHATFNIQTATRLVEFFLLDLAMEEMENGKRIWDYFDRKPTAKRNIPEEDEKPWTGDAQIKVFLDEETGEASFSMQSKSKFVHKTRWNPELIQFLIDLQNKVEPFLAAAYMPILTCHKRKGQVFRGHPNYRGKGPWKDWVWIDWGAQYGRLPAHIWCFVVLKDCKGMPSGRNSIQHGGIPLQAETYAVIENATLVEGNSTGMNSDLFQPIMKDVELNDAGIITKRTFYLANTEAFSDPCCVIPNLGGASNAYFVVKPRNQWAGEFLRWVEDQHNLDVMDDLKLTERNTSSDEEKPTKKPKRRRKRSKHRPGIPRNL